MLQAKAQPAWWYIIFLAVTLVITQCICIMVAISVALNDITSLLHKGQLLLHTCLHVLTVAAAIMKASSSQLWTNTVVVNLHCLLSWLTVALENL